MKQKHQRQRIWLTAVMPDLKYLIRTLGLVQIQQGQLHTNPQVFLEPPKMTS